MANNLNLVEKAANLPELPNREAVLKRAREAKPTEMSALHGDLRALARPATMRDIGENMLILVGCFPNAKTEDTEIFGRSLVQYVTETQPSLSDLEATRHKLIKTLVFRPSIAEILWALAATKRERLECADRIEYLVNNPKPQYSIGVQRPRPQPTSKPSNATLDWIEERQAAYSAESQDDDPNNRDIPF